jgi:hypothetical protein
MFPDSPDEADDEGDQQQDNQQPHQAVSEILGVVERQALLAV